MAAQTRKAKPERKQEQRATQPPAPAGQAPIAERAKRIKDEAAKVADAIDDVLEKNAEEFVKSYVQRGGE